jgi:hypothetical protein
MQQNKYAVFILTNGRPNNVITYNTLRRHGYTGKIYIIIDDEDKTKHEYLENYGNEVIIFSKKEYENTFDIMDNFEGNKVIVYARNACWDIARKLNLKYFLEFEDDYNNFQMRYQDGKYLAQKNVKNLDKIFDIFLQCLSKTKIRSIAFAQGGDYIGGNLDILQNYKRKAMNTFFFAVNAKKNDLQFLGRMNDDVNTYLNYGKTGQIFLQVGSMQVNQSQTQKNIGGNTEAYKNYGTYVKSFYSVMVAPNCCKVSTMGSKERRIHHKISWAYAVPKIISQLHCKNNNGI